MSVTVDVQESDGGGKETRLSEWMQFAQVAVYLPVSVAVPPASSPLEPGVYYNNTHFSFCN